MLIKWAVEWDMLVIPRSTNPDRIKESLDSAELELNKDDHANIKELNIPYRYLDVDMMETASEIIAIFLMIKKEADSFRRLMTSSVRS